MKRTGFLEVDEVDRLVSDERERLMREAGLNADQKHYQRIEESPFTAEERASTTILFGNLTWKHEILIKSVFEGGGYRFQNLPAPTKVAFRIGKEYCNNGLCNPNYFTAGSLVQYLQALEAKGLTRREIMQNYVYFTAADCGPCRFGMYESEYRQALHNAGFPGFRVLTFRNNTVIRGGSNESGLKFSMDLGMGILNAIIAGDLLYKTAYRIRPYEVREGETDRAMEECVHLLAQFLRTRKHFEILEDTPRWFSNYVAQKKFKNLLNSLGKFRRHLYGADYQAMLKTCADRLNQVEVDRTRPKPIVKIVGEFYSHLSENDANYNMFSFLENEGAEARVDAITSLVLYWLHKAKLDHARRKGLDAPYPNPYWWQLWRRLVNQAAFLKKPLLFSLANRIYTRQYHRINEALGGLAHSLLSQEELVRAAKTFYHPLTRGGEGHLEVAKSIYYTNHRLCHMVLSLKPFGCMPSTQSDGVMAAVTSHYEDMLFVSIETTGDGDISALSRVQMTLGDARRKAQAEFEQALKLTGRRLEDIREYIAARPKLRRPFYAFPHRPDTAGVAANFILHVSDLMDRNRDE